MCKSFNFFTNPCYFSFYFLINLLTIYPPHFPFVNHMFIVYVCESVSVLYIESFVLFLDSTDKWYHILFGFFCLTYFSKLNILLGPSMCCKWQYFILFYAWVVLYCIYVPHLLYPFLCWGMFWLFPCLGYCKWYYCEYWGTCIFSDYSFLWVYAQEWIFNVNSYVKVTFKLRQIIRFLDWRTWQQFGKNI